MIQNSRFYTFFPSQQCAAGQRIAIVPIKARILQWGRCNAILPVLAIFVHRKAVFAILMEKARWEDVFAMQSEMASKVNRETILAIPLKKASILKGYGMEEIEAFLSYLTVRL